MDKMNPENSPLEDMEENIETGFILGYNQAFKDVEKIIDECKIKEWYVEWRSSKNKNSFYEEIRNNLKQEIKNLKNNSHVSRLSASAKGINLHDTQGKDNSNAKLKSSQPAVCEGCEEEEKNCTGVYMECIKKR